MHIIWGKSKKAWEQGESATYSKGVQKIQMVKVTAHNSHLLMQEKVTCWLTYLGRMLGTVAGIKGTAEEPGAAVGNWNSEVIINSSRQIMCSFYLTYFPQENLPHSLAKVAIRLYLVLSHTSTTEVLCPDVHKSGKSDVHKTGPTFRVARFNKQKYRTPI